MKTCTKCSETKALTEFGASKSARDGKKGDCKACRNMMQRADRAENPGRVRARDAKRRADHSEKITASKAEYRSKRRAEHPDELRASKAAWAAANHERCRIYAHTRRARRLEHGGTLSLGLSARLFKLQRSMCPCCNQTLGDDFELDHNMPLALGGSNTDKNAQLLRKQCNRQKHAKHPVDFMQERGFLL